MLIIIAWTNKTHSPYLCMPWHLSKKQVTFVISVCSRLPLTTSTIQEVYYLMSHTVRSEWEAVRKCLKEKVENTFNDEKSSAIWDKLKSQVICLWRMKICYRFRRGSWVCFFVVFFQASGVKVNAKCSQEFEKMKMNKEYRYVIFKLNDKLTEIVVDECGPRGWWNLCSSQYFSDYWSHSRPIG